MGPEYRRPEPPVPTTIGDSASVAEIKLPEWSVYFADDTLRELITRALEYNRDLRVATARVEEARGRRSRAQVFWGRAAAVLDRLAASLKDDGDLRRSFLAQPAVEAVRRSAKLTTRAAPPGGAVPGRVGRRPGSPRRDQRPS